MRSVRGSGRSVKRKVGALKERLGFADFNRAMRDALLACTRFDWSRISPAIFGSLFQGIMEAKERRQTGGHYTSETDILKVINALFMDSLRAEFAKARRNKAMLKQFHAKLGRLRFLDPACGCGNFLVITYRELRLLEIEVLHILHSGEVQLQLNVHELSIVDVDAFYGIEIQEWPARIAEVALWLMDHQMNIRLSETFGQYFVRLPLRKSAHITLGNALRLDWKTILPPDQCSYVLGNPPFVGKKEQDTSQKADMELIAGRLESRYQYSNNIVYNNYPWPEKPTAAQKVAVETAAKTVLDAREKHALSTLADMYDPLYMPADLVKAHAVLDRAVDRCYQKQPFTSDTQRLELLFALYENYTTPLLPPTKPQRRPRSRRPTQKE